MELDIRWDDQHPGVIVMKYDQAASWDEILEVFETQAQMAARVSRQVAVIILQHEAIHMPGGDWLAVARQLMRSQPANVKEVGSHAALRHKDWAASFMRRPRVIQCLGLFGTLFDCLGHLSN